MSKEQMRTLRAEVGSIKNALRSLTKVTKVAPEAVQRLFSRPDVARELFRTKCVSTGKGECVVLFEPSDFLRGFLAAFRARKLDRKIIKKAHIRSPKRSVSGMSKLAR